MSVKGDSGIDPAAMNAICVGEAMPMRRQSVSSSVIRSIGYDETTRTLEIEFQSGKVYRYFGVEPEVYRALMAAPSHGKYFLAAIRDVYRYTEVR